jgi:hypothetical protein
MPELYKTKYPNNQRTVTGTPTLYGDDVVLNCDTSGAPVVINLFDIPENFWSTTWKLYVNDSGGNASTNNITINAGAGQTINGVASLTISTDNGSAIVRIATNATYVASLDNTIIGNGHVIEDEDVPLPQQPVLNFTGDAVEATDGAGQTDVTINVPDTGWIDLNGFSWITAAQRPQYRIISKQLVFRGRLVVPIEAGGVIIPWANDNSYAADTTIVPATVDAEGVTINAAGSITFNKGGAVLTDAAHFPDVTYATNWVVAAQRKESSIGSNNVAYYTTVFRIFITSAGLLTLQCLKDAEQDFGTQQIGQSNLRYLVSQTIAGDRISDYRNIEDSVATKATLIGRSNVGTATDPFSIGLNTDAANHAITHDPANETDIGGYGMAIIDLKGFLN